MKNLKNFSVKILLSLSKSFLTFNMHVSKKLIILLTLFYASIPKQLGELVFLKVLSQTFVTYKQLTNETMASPQILLSLAILNCNYT